MAREATYSSAELDAGIAATELIVKPASWINRRVETIELLSKEETRRRVSIDFTLSQEKAAALQTEDGVVAPISVLTKEARRNFDLRDESGAAVPVLGKDSNAALAHVALMSAVLDALPGDLSTEAFELLWSDLRQVVVSDVEQAEAALGLFVGSAEEGDSLRSAIWDNEECRSLLGVLRQNYVLFAVLAPGGPSRRILKYSYSEDFDLEMEGTLKEHLTPARLRERASRPDRSQFIVLCPGAWRARSFHAEIAIPEDLRVEAAVLFDFVNERAMGEPQFNCNRASLYASEELEEETSPDAYVVVAPERRGRSSQAVATGVLVAALLWLGVASGLDAKEPDAAVSILLAGAALYSGVVAVRSEHLLVTKLFSASRRWLAVAALAALAASSSLAMQIPNAHPTGVWRVAAIAATVASVRLAWSAIRAPV